MLFVYFSLVYELYTCCLFISAWFTSYTRVVCLFQPGLRAIHVLFVYFSLVYELYTCCLFISAWFTSYTRVVCLFQPGLRAIHVVARSGDIELTRELLQRHANVNFCTSVRFVYKKIKGFVHNKLKGGNMERGAKWLALR